MRLQETPHEDRAAALPDAGLDEVAGNPVGKDRIHAVVQVVHAGTTNHGVGDKGEVSGCNQFGRGAIGGVGSNLYPATTPAHFLHSCVQLTVAGVQKFTCHLIQRGLAWEQ
ncbi:hypothetical protein SDC9_160017 [bioreactor metagenome]|uniref:Uncharacterized protein n=1 Tax=bioreactor metagenome TaxID=1076179 RepID=A0A645FE76_9ZZZZ